MAITVHLHRPGAPAWRWRWRDDAGEFKEEEHPRGKAGGEHGGQFVKKGEEGGGGAEKPAPSPASNYTEENYDQPIPEEIGAGLLKYGFRRGSYYSGTHIFRKEIGTTGGHHVEVYAASDPAEPNHWLLLVDRGTEAMPMIQGQGWESLKKALGEHGFSERQAPRVAPDMLRAVGAHAFNIKDETEDGVVKLKDWDGNTIEIKPPAEEDGDSDWTLKSGDKTWTGTGLAALTDKISGEMRDVQRARSRAEVARIVRETSVQLGWNPDQVEIVDDEYKFELGGRTRTAAGSAQIYGPPESRGIKIYAQNVQPDNAKGLMAHEVMHQKYQAVLDAAIADKKAIIALAQERRENQLRTGAPIEPLVDDQNQLLPEYRAQFPFYARLQPLLGVPDQYGYDHRAFNRFKKDDGVTQYSRDWWATTDDPTYGHQRAHNAFHETLAEMSMLRQTTGDPDGKGPWRELWNAVAVGWWQLPQAAPRRKEALAARRKSKKKAA